jgi:hypothetical protein
MKKNKWMAGVSTFLALWCLVNWPDFESWSRDEMVGLLFLSICSLVISTIVLAQGHKGKILSWIATAVSICTILLVFGEM